MADHEKMSLLPIGADSAAVSVKVKATAPERESGKVELALALFRSALKKKPKAVGNRHKGKEGLT